LHVAVPVGVGGVGGEAELGVEPVEGPLGRRRVGPDGVLVGRVG